MIKYPVIDVYRTGQNIRRIMQIKGLTVRDVQKYLGFATPQAVYHWFNGRSMPSLDNFYALSELFQVSVDAMLCGNRKWKGDYRVDYQISFGRSNSQLRLYYEQFSVRQAG